jgi:hypothetical protein
MVGEMHVVWWVLCMPIVGGLPVEKYRLLKLLKTKSALRAYQKLCRAFLFLP